MLEDARESNKENDLEQMRRKCKISLLTKPTSINPRNWLTDRKIRSLDAL